jgi:hypothetical protein
MGQIIDCRHLFSWHCLQMTDDVVEIGTIGWREYLAKVKKLTLRRCYLRFFSNPCLYISQGKA